MKNGGFSCLSRFLLDTCTLIWLTQEPEALSVACREAIDDQDNAIWCSDVSSLEITLKWRTKKLKLPNEPRKWFEEQLSIWQPAPLPLTRLYIYRAGELDLLHRDPFDRLLIGQSIAEGMILWSPDPAFSRFSARVLW